VSSLSTHVLDTSVGRPAAGVAVTLDTTSDASWQRVTETTTDDDGRVGDFGSLTAGLYRLTFDVAGYFGVTTFFPEVAVTFRLADLGHHHVPLLVSPFAYSTYRGS
jgi:5-hydroxyisourate hydrolase